MAIDLNTSKIKRFYKISNQPENRSMYITPNGEIMILQDEQYPTNDISHSLFDIVVFGDGHYNEHGIEFSREGYVRCRIDADLTYICIYKMPNSSQLQTIEDVFQNVVYDVYLVDYKGRQVLANKSTLTDDIQAFIRSGGDN